MPHELSTFFASCSWPDHLREAMEEFYMYRQESKHPMTPTAVTRFIRLINKYVSWKHHPDDIVDAIDRSIRNGWRDVFLKPISRSEHRDRLMTRPEKYMELYTDEERKRLLA